MAARLHPAIAARFAVAASFWVAIDQAVKWAVVEVLPEGSRVAHLGGFLQVVHVRNPGGAFGILADLPLELRLPAFAAVFALAALLIASLLRHVAPGESGAVGWTHALAAIFGGAASNLIDRLLPGRDGAVIDALHVRLWRGVPWPDFNVADACIVFGLVALAISLSAREGEARARVSED